MPKAEVKTETKSAISEKISIGFMVATGILVVVSFLFAAGYLAVNKFSGTSASIVTTTPTDPVVNDTVDTQVLGDQADYTFTTE